MDNHIVHKPALRAGLVLWSVGLAVLWIISVSQGAATWFAWVDLVGAGLGLYAALILSYVPSSVAIASGATFGLGIIALWIVGLAVGVRDWITWVSFGLSILLLLGTMITAARSARERRMAPQQP